MANLTAITGNWHQTAGSNTSFSGVATTAADNITIPNGVTVTIVSGVVALCRSLTVENGATLIFGNSTSTLNIGDATLGTGNVALSIGATATITYTSGTPSIQFLSTNSTAQTITTNGKTLPNVTFNGVGGKWQLQDALTCSGTITTTAGGFFGNGQTITASSFSGGTTGVRTVDITNCSFTLTAGGTTPWNFGYSPPANLTFVSTGSTITFTGPLSLEFRGGGLTYNNFVNTMTTATTPIQMRGTNTFNNLTFTGAAGTACSVMLAANQTVTGTLTVTGNSSTNRVLCYSDTLGTPRVITAAAVSLTDVDFMDIAIVGPTGSTITSDSFNRANGALAGSSTDNYDGGSTKTWTQVSGTTNIASNEAASATSGSNLATIDAGTDNYYVEATLAGMSAARAYGVLARVNGSNNVLYAVASNASGATSNGFFGYIVDGVTTDFVTGSNITGNPGFATGDTIGLQVCGKVAAMYRNGVRVTAYYQIPSSLVGNNVGITTLATAPSSVDNFRVLTQPSVTGTRLGDCLGNSGITFTTASGTARDGGGAGVKRYAVAPGNFSDTAMWSETSGGSPGASVPLPQDDVYLDANSAAGTYNINMPRSCRNLDCTGFTRTLNNGGSEWSLYGNLKIVPGMTWGFTSIGPNLRGRGTQTIDTSGIVPGGGITNTNIISPGGSYTLLSNLSLGLTTQSYFGHFAGTFNANGFDVTIGRIDTPGSLVRTLNLGSGTWRVGYNTSFVVNISATTSLIADSSTIIVDSTYTAERSFIAPTGSVFGTVTYTVADSPGALTITGSNTFNTINIGSGRSLKLTSGTTQKIGTLNLNGVPRGGVRLPGVSGSYLSTPDSAALSVTGDIDIRCRVALPDYTSADSGLVGKWGAAGQRSFRFFFDSLGRLNFTISTDGTASAGFQWQAGPTFVDGTTYWVRTTRTAARTLRFFYAADQPTMPTSWTEAGLSQTLSAGQNIFDSTSPVEIGSITLGMANLANGVFHRAQIRNNVLDDGTGIVFDTDFSNQFGPHYVDSSTNRAIVTPSTTLANVGDGRVVIESVTAGSAATLEVGSTTGMNYVDLKDVVMNGADTYIGATSVIRSNVKGVRRGPKTGMSMMMGV